MIPHTETVWSDRIYKIDPVFVIDLGSDHQCFYDDYNSYKNTDSWLFSRGLCYKALLKATEIHIYSYKRRKAGYTS